MLFVIGLTTYGKEAILIFSQKYYEDAQMIEKKERLISLGSPEFASLLSDQHKLVSTRIDDFCKWMREEVERKFLSKQPSKTDSQIRAKKNLTEFYASLEVTHDLSSWVDRWITLFEHVKKAPKSRIDELRAYYEEMAERENWEPLEESNNESETCPQIHDIIQRGFTLSAQGKDDMECIEELEAFCNRDGNITQKDNSGMTALQRCTMLGWEAGEEILIRYGA